MRVSSGGGGTITSASIPDPYVPPDGNWNVTGDITVSGDVEGGTLTSGAGLALSGAITGATTIAASGDITVTGANISANANADSTHIFGRIKLFSTLSDAAMFSHFDHADTNGCALYQTSTGRTVLQSKSGTVITFAYAGSSKMDFTGASNDFHPSSAGLVSLGSTQPWSTVHQQINAIGAVSTDAALGAEMINNTEALLNAQQYSPARVLQGEGWQKVANTSHPVGFMQQVIPVQQGDSVLPTGELHWFSEIDDAGWVSRMSLSSTGLLTSTLDGVDATSEDADIGHLLINTTPAADGLQQFSPARVLGGAAWKSDATAESRSVKWMEQVIAVQGTSEVTSLLHWFSEINDGGFVSRMNLSSAGNLSVMPDTNATTILGRCLLDSRSSDRAYFSHIDLVGTGDFALQQASNGRVTLNAPGGDWITLAINNAAMFLMDTTSGFYANNAAGPAVQNIAAAAGAAVFPNDRTELTSGFGGAKDAPALVVQGANVATATAGLLSVVAMPKGMMRVAANGTAQTINSTNEKHGVVTTGMTFGHLKGFSFEAGTTGTITEVVQASSDIRITTSAPHGLTEDEIVVQNDLSDPNYVGIFTVTNVSDTTHYDVTATWGATDTGFFQRPDTLVADAGVSGDFMINVCFSNEPAGANPIFDFWISQNAAVDAGSEQRRKFGGIGDVGFIALCNFFTVAAGDRFAMIITNTAASGNITNRNIMFEIGQA